MAEKLSSDAQKRADRFKRLREYHEFATQTAFAAHLHISLTRWNNYEKRGLPLSRPMEDHLVEITPGLTVDWLRNGSRRGLSVQLDRQLNQPQKGRLSGSNSA